MSVEQVVRCCGPLAGIFFSHLKQTGGDGRFKASKMEKVIKEIVKEQTGQENEGMIQMSSHAKRCKRGRSTIIPVL